MAAAPAILPALPLPAPLQPPQNSAQIAQLLDFPGVFKGHELTRKDRYLSSGIAPLDRLLTGGIPRGRISEIIGEKTSGKTTLAASFAATASRRGEVIGWIDAAGAFDPRSIADAGADLSRILWLGFDPNARADSIQRRRHSRELKAAELILDAGGFGLLVIDFGAMRFALSQSCALRIARAAERSATAVLVLAAGRMCGTFAALTLAVEKPRAAFSRVASGAPALFDGLRFDAVVARSKLGIFGDRVELHAAIDPRAVHPFSDRQVFGARVTAFRSPTFPRRRDAAAS
jgi:hypothetical protein